MVVAGGKGAGWGEGEGKGDRERYNRAEAPFARYSVQLHFATSILPAHLHSHSVDPFTEGMSHTPSPFLPSYSLFLFQTLAHRLCCSPPPPTDPVSVTVTDSSLSILSRPSLSSIQARQHLPPLPRPSFSRIPSLFLFHCCLSLSLSCFLPPSLSPSFLPSFPFPFLSRSLVHSTKVSLFLSDSVV